MTSPEPVTASSSASPPAAPSASPASTTTSAPDPAARLRPLRCADHAAVLAAAVAARAAGGIPVVGDERWADELFTAQVENAAHTLRALALRGLDLAGRIGWAAFTSGSTSRPRAVLRTDASWQAGHRVAAGWLGLTPGEELLMPVHPVSSMAVNAASFCASTGARLRVSAHARLTAADLAGPAALHGTPAQLTDALDLLDGGAPTTLRVVLVGGDRLPTAARERAARHGLRVVHYYGSAEASFVAADLDGAGLRPLPGVRLRVAGAAAASAPAGIRLAAMEPTVVTPTITTGVLEVLSDQLAAPDDSLLASGAPRWPADSWLTTGDRADWDPGRNLLTVHGRADDVILTAGATVAPADVEAELAAVVGLEGGPLATGVVVLGVPDARLGQRVCAVVEPAPGADPDDVLARLREAARTRLSPAARPRRWVLVERLERTGSGKIRRVLPDAAREAGA